MLTTQPANESSTRLTDDDLKKAPGSCKPQRVESFGGGLCSAIDLKKGVMMMMIRYLFFIVFLF